MSPTEDVLTQALAFLSDPATGLNPQLVQQFTARNLPIPVPGMGGSASTPFDFGENSANVFTFRADPDWINERQQAQFPCLFLYGISAVQSMDAYRVQGAMFWGDISIGMDCWMAYSGGELPANNDFDTPISALEETFLRVLNTNSCVWQSPVLYSNNLRFERPKPMRNQNQEGNDIYRTGLRMVLTAKYLLTPF